ncbi:carboxypeptidase-like regulatory domain-containing protein [Bernardetia sp. Wsw4-3y2]|uniref:carboxypeptidase-like regulatory domain-containing protein n=1 Tax=Bernardetia sp. Wsw4-3y2 TaxID=3127471 RepID=UPI0030CCFE5C
MLCPSYCPEYGALPGATIQLKGTTRGTTTDMEGNFSFTVPFADEIIIVARFVGYEAREEIVTENTSQNLTLQLHDYELLGEVSVNEVYQSKQTVWQKFKGLFR